MNRVVTFLCALLVTQLSIDARHAHAFVGHFTSDVKGDAIKSLSVGGLQRTYLLHLPPNFDLGKRLPLVIVLHGGGGNHRFALRMSSMSAKADKEGFVVVYPDGSGRLPGHILTWNAGECCGYAQKKAVDDVGFIGALIDELVVNLNVDPKRVFVTGVSNGGMLTYQLGCQLSSKIAAIAPVAGSMTGEEIEPTEPVSVIAFHGTADRHVPYNGGTGKLACWGFPVNKQSVSYAISYWIRHDNCSLVPKLCVSGNIESKTYTGGEGGTEVVLYSINGQGHAWPGGRKAWFGADEPTKEILATDIIWDFFLRHHKQ